MSSWQGFRAVIDGYAPAATPTDIITLFGDSGKVIELVSWEIHYTATSGATLFDAKLIKRSTANSGGTSSVITPVALEPQGQGNQRGVLTKYTANPAGLGTAVGTVAYAQIVAAVNGGRFDLYRAMELPREGVRARGALQGLCLNLNGVTVPGSGVLVTNIIEWRELFA